MRPIAQAGMATLVVTALAWRAWAEAGSSPQTWGFESDKVGEAPAGFSFARTGGGAAGRWVVRTEKEAPSGAQVLAQVDADDTDYRFPVAVAELPVQSELSVSVRCKPVSGKVDQACGLVWRYLDENNYYLARANALENNVRLYYVKEGRRAQLGSWSGKVASNVWHQLRADAQGEHFQIYWDGKKVIDARDPTFPGAGKVGVWTKADSVTLFDELTVSSR